MSYLTFEVEIDHGKVMAKEPSKLPEKATGLLTIFQPDDAGQSKANPLQAWKALQEHLGLDTKGATQWLSDVKGARR
jgi:hypothetical protein